MGSYLNTIPNRSSMLIYGESVKGMIKMGLKSIQPDDALLNREWEHLDADLETRPDEPH
jgi:hypothetical protein